MQERANRRTVLWPLASLLILATGCGSPDDDKSVNHVESTLTAGRWIEHEPSEMLEGTVSARPVFTWDFGDQRTPEGWRCVNVAPECTVRDDQLELTASSKDPQIIHSIDLLADRSHIIRVTTARSSMNAMQLFWAEGKNPFSSERRIDLTPIAPSPNAQTTIYQATLGRHPHWSGRLARVRLDPVLTTGGQVAIREIAFHRSSLTAEQAAPPRAWKADISSDVRSALLVAPGDRFARELDVPVDAEIRFALAAGPVIDTPSTDPTAAAVELEDLTCRVQIQPQGAALETLLTTQLSPSSRWQDEVVDLSAYAGQRVTVTLEALPADDGATSTTVLWANPEVVSRTAKWSQPNVILISLDTLRADRLSINGYKRRTSPRIDAWARRLGVNFTQAIAHAPWTIPSHVSMLTGLEPVRHGVNYDQPVPTSLTTIAEILRAEGYQTVAVTGGGYLRPEYDFHQGFDTFQYTPTSFEDGELTDGLERVSSFLTSRSSQPFFLFFHTYEIHSPYLAREPYYSNFESRAFAAPERVRYARRPGAAKGDAAAFGFTWQEDRASEPSPLPEEQLPLLDALYDSAIAFTDAALGGLFDQMGELGLERQTVVVLTSDHGESLGESGRAGHYHLYEENIRVPLIVASPGLEPASTVIDRQVRSIDIVPTILDLAGVEATAHNFDGTSLVPLLTGDSSSFPDAAISYAAHTNRGISLRLDDSLKYILHNSPWPKTVDPEELYLPRDDPSESADLIDDRTAEAAALRERVEEALLAVPSLRLHFSAKDGQLEGKVHGHFAAVAVKSVGRSCDCLEYSKGAGFRFAVPPGESYTLALERIVGQRLRFVGTWTATGETAAIPFDWEVDAHDEDGSLSFALDGQRWASEQGRESAVANGITVARHGGSSELAVSPSSDNEQLRKQLEALGYVDH